MHFTYAADWSKARHCWEMLRRVMYSLISRRIHNIWTRWGISVNRNINGVKKYNGQKRKEIIKLCGNYKALRGLSQVFLLPWLSQYGG